MAAAMLAGAAPSRADQPEAVAESPFGVVGPWPGIETAGIKWCRVGAGATSLVNWPEIEKSPDTWDWAAADRELKRLADPLKLSLLPIFGYTPQWASRRPADKEFQSYPPRDVACFSRFVHQCVARYKQRVKVWEVWNEPDISFFRGSVAEYAEMVKAAAVAARQADPNCRIAMGSAGVDLPFLERLYEFGCGPYFDVMSVHPYQWGRELNDRWMVDKLQQCRRLMDRHGDRHKEIWATEFGWSLSDGVTAAEQADLLAQAVVTLLTVRERLKVEKLFWFCVKDWGGPGPGLLDDAGKPKPALLAYRATTTALAGARYRGPWPTPERVRGHVFDHAGEPILVLWTPSADGKIRMELKTAATKLVLRTVTNQLVALTPCGGKAVLDVTHAPVFITGMSRAELQPIAARPPAAASPAASRPRLPDVWLSVVPPPTTARPYVVLGGTNGLPLRVHNDGTAAAEGEVQLDLTSEDGPLATGRLPFRVAPATSQTIAWRVTLPANKKQIGRLATLRLRGLSGGQPLAPIDLPVRLASAPVVEFTANSWVEQQYLHEAEKSGCSESERFGNEFGYRFALGRARSARLRIDVGANGAKPWKVFVSNDDKRYTLACSGEQPGRRGRP